MTLPGAIHGGDAAAGQAQADLLIAYNNAAARPTMIDLTGHDLGGLTLTPGVYEFSSSAQLTGDLTLNALGDPNAVFVFKIGSTLTTASNSRVLFINGARFCRTFWQVGSSATLGTSTDFKGHIFALTSITALTDATVQGQLLALNGAVTLDSNTITNGPCDTAATLHIIKHVVNDHGGTAVASDFSIHVQTEDEDVYGSPAAGAESPGTTYTVLAGDYVISEDANSGYTTSFGGDSDSNGHITLEPGDNKTVTVTNNDIAPAPSLVVTKTADPASGTLVVPGQTIEYRIGYTNSSETNANYDIVLADTLGPEVTYQPDSLMLNGVPIPDSGNYDPLTHTIAVTLPSVAAQASGVLTFKVTVGPWSASRAGIMNVASWSVGGVDQGDTPPVYSYVDSLDITKSVRNTSGTTLRTGSVLEWTVVVTNRGIVPATNVVATDSVPANTTYVQGSITGPGADAVHSPAMTWNVGTLGVGQSVTLTFRSSVNANVANGTVVVNQASVQSDQSPPRSAVVRTAGVNDSTTRSVRTSGAEGITLGLLGLLGMLSLGFAWSGRNAGTPGLKRGRRITASIMLAALIVTGGMEAGASFGLPLPSPGEALSSAVQTVAPTDSGPAANAPDGAGVVGRVRIPAIGANVKLVEGKSASSLSRGSWRQPTSAKLGEAGAAVIAGHRISSQFSRLPGLKVGNRVRVTLGRRTFNYRVTSISTQRADNNRLSFRTGAKEKLILYTCVPRWRGDKRTVVTCTRVK